MSNPKRKGPSAGFAGNLEGLEALQKVSADVAKAVAPIQQLGARIAEQFSPLARQQAEIARTLSQVTESIRASQAAYNIDFGPMLQQHSLAIDAWSKAVADLQMPWFDNLNSLRLVPDNQWAETFQHFGQQTTKSKYSELLDAVHQSLADDLAQARREEGLDASGVVLRSASKVGADFPQVSPDTVVTLVVMMFLTLLSVLSGRTDTDRIVATLDKLIEIQGPPGVTDAQGVGPVEPRMVVTRTAHLREGPSSQHDSLRKLVAGTIVYPRGTLKGWIEVYQDLPDVGFVEGWVSTRFLKPVQ